VSFNVSLLPAAEDDLDRLYDFILERELAREGDLNLAAAAVAAIRSGVQTLERHPFTCRKSADSPFLRELIIPFASTGYVALFEIVSNELVLVAAIRHQREDDYH